MAARVARAAGFVPGLRPYSVSQQPAQDPAEQQPAEQLSQAQAPPSLQAQPSSSHEQSSQVQASPQQAVEQVLGKIESLLYQQNPEK